MVSMSICRNKQMLLAWRPWKYCGLEQGEVGEAEHFTDTRMVTI